MTWAIIDQYGAIAQTGFDSEEEAKDWLQKFKATATVEKDDGSREA